MLEVCVDSIESAMEAGRGGGDRIELCAALSEGGLTPSVGLLKQVLENVSIPVVAMIRPRCGDFVYSEGDALVMIDDIDALAKAGAKGFVFGCLNKDQGVDVPLCRRLLLRANHLPCTFHRAIDLVADVKVALDQLVELGFSRVLTSGGSAKAIDGVSRIRHIAEVLQGRVKVLVGGGVSPDNSLDLLRKLGEFGCDLHASARSPYRHDVKMEDPGKVSTCCVSEFAPVMMRCDADKVRAIKTIIDNFNT